MAVLSEHHGTDDNHLPAPLILAAAIAARTLSNSMILLAAVVLPLCDPVRLAEEMSVLDIVSRGRVAYVFGVGHRREEYEQFGVDYNRRGALADEKLSLLRGFSPASGPTTTAAPPSSLRLRPSATAARGC